LAKGISSLTFLACSPASVFIVAAEPGVGGRREGGEAILTIGNNLGLSASDEHGIQQVLLGFGVLPKPDLVPLHFREVGFGEPVLQLLPQRDDRPGSRPITV
jgi:hypothetical protein